jgi:hypothetical protein
MLLAGDGCRRTHSHRRPAAPTRRSGRTVGRAQHATSAGTRFGGRWLIPRDVTASNARRRERNARKRSDRHAIFRAGYAWLRDRGLYRREITELLDVRHETVSHWLANRGKDIRVAERMAFLLRSSVDVPAWSDRKRGQAHPWLPVLRARLEALAV